MNTLCVFIFVTSGQGGTNAGKRSSQLGESYRLIRRHINQEKYASPWKRRTTYTRCHGIRRSHLHAVEDVAIAGSKTTGRINSYGTFPKRSCSERLFKFTRSNRSAFKIADVDDYNISETITTTETSFGQIGSVTLDLTSSENGTRISLTVSEIFDRKHVEYALMVRAIVNANPNSKK